MLASDHRPKGRGDIFLRATANPFRCSANDGTLAVVSATSEAGVVLAGIFFCGASASANTYVVHVFTNFTGAWCRHIVEPAPGALKRTISSSSP